MRRKFIQNGVVLDYDFEHKAVKNLNLRVRSDGSVYVSAPRKTPIKTVEAFISANFDRIIAAQNKFAVIRENEEKQSPQALTDGAAVRILGENVTVKIEKSVKTEVEFNRDEHCLRIFLPETAPESADEAYNKWKKNIPGKFSPKY